MLDGYLHSLFLFNILFFNSFSDGDHGFDGFFPLFPIVPSEHPLPDVIDSDMNAGFEFDAIHWQPPCSQPILSCKVHRDRFEAVVVDYPSDYVDVLVIELS